ncbi:MAG TPA: beta-propeller fold lactonase family protein, partial [Terriglobales bacterium]|nr:beta-propeller fold lactonase family protein [Terriglobales bacterium]
MHNVVERLSRRRSLFASLTVAGLCTIVLSSALFAATQQLVTGKRISPVGVNTEVGNLPMNMIKSPNGKFAIISDMGFNQWLSSVDVKTGAIISQVDFGQQPVSNTYGLYHGVAFAPGNGPDYTVYAAMGENQTIAVLNLDKDGNLTLLNTNTFAVKAHDFPSGLAVDNKGNLYVANNDPDTFAQPTSIAIYNPAGAEIGRYAFSSSYGGTPNFPLAIATFADGSKTYVGSQRDGAVYVLNTTDPGNITLTATINTGSHPVGLTFNQSQSLLYVANAHSDTISVVATGNDTVVNTLAFKVPELENAIGATPLQTYISQDGSTLYAALADMNAVAIATIAGNNLVLQGYIPVGWYPTAVVADDSNQRLLVTNAKGVKTMNPSPCYKLWEFNDNPCYDLNEMQGTVAALDVPTHDQLVHYTNQVLANNSVALSSTKNLDSIGLKAGGIQHIIYIVKENRTYDQILGDIPQGNGDPSLVLFGESITPSQHALTKRFVLLDNFYDSGEASGDGWPWSTQAMGSEYDLKNLPYNYSGR